MKRPMTPAEKLLTAILGSTKLGVCPTCGAEQPHLHPAIQHEGEVSPCADPYHRIITPSNTPEKVAELEELLERIANAVRH